MRVNVHVFARLRDLVGRGAVTCEVPPGASARDVWRALVSEHPTLEPFATSVSCAINEDFARMSATVEDGDDVAFLPPVSGGGHPCR